jgi:hypothetical protein
VAVEVATNFASRMLFGLVVGAGILLVAVVFGRRLGRPHRPPIALGALIGLGLVFLAIPLVLFFERGRTIRRFDAAGVTRYDGRAFTWADFRGAHPITRFVRAQGGSADIGFALDFAGGQAVVLHSYVTNWPELEPLLRAAERRDLQELKQRLARRR